VVVTQDGFDRFEVQRHATAVNQRLKNLVLLRRLSKIRFQLNST
jgi:hypothetical protein